MLVLSRKTGERIKLELPDGREILFGPVRIGPNNVRLGITAPDDIGIVREELLGPAPDLDERVREAAARFAEQGDAA